jgi:2-polyprenyl-3-methyl-5-hydroxy-6-metoxy-1,4-benzoquinol methylase
MTAPGVQDGRVCAWCGHADLVDVYRIFNKTIIRCRACALMQTYPRASAEELAQLYSTNYYSNEGLVAPGSDNIYGYADYLSERLNKQRKYSGIVRRIERHLVRGGVTSREILDVGCGYGFFLDSAVDFGFEPFGIEFNEHAIDRLKRRYAFTVRQSGESFDGVFPDRTFACIALLDTIEHLVDPFRALDTIHRMLRPNGVVVIATMDSTSVMSRLLGARLEDFRRIREHLYFFDRRTLRSVLERKGFEVLDISSIGHTFELGHLLQRISGSFAIFRPALAAVTALGMAHVNVSLNPRTKMIVYARRRG